MEGLFLGVGVVLGAVLVWFLAVRGKADHTDELRRLFGENEGLKKQIEVRENAHEEKLNELKEMRNSAADAFKLLAQDALKDNNEEFAKAAGEKISPLSDQLKEYEELLVKMQRDHTAQASRTLESVTNLTIELDKQRAMATDLKSILKGPTQRGRVGEMMLEVLLERVGLVEGQHFKMQQSSLIDGQVRRPDCTVFMPNKGRLVIDCKTPLNSYHDAMELEDDEERTKHLKQHAANVRRDVDKLAGKQYRDEAVGNSMVVMYLPIESSLAAALYHDAEIMDYGLERNVVLSSPTLLFALLQTIALGWQQEQLRESTEEVKKLGTELVTRVRKVAEHMTKVGSRLDSTVEAYNESVGSIDRMLFSTARQFQKLGASADTKGLELRDAIVPIRRFDKTELQAAPSDAEIDDLTGFEEDAAISSESVET